MSFLGGCEPAFDSTDGFVPEHVVVHRHAASVERVPANVHVGTSRAIGQ